ncbi:MAG: PD-(D/E)XK nuclease family protein [Bacteroidaceae bacterium]|nr:PD-(D/E)XK nuclease family protein [Bacteroidaceae bacterium]
MDKELELLSDWLKHQNDLPKKRTHKETLLDIAGIDHLENHWSDIYAYFFNPKASHGLSRLFIDSLQDILCSKTEQSPLMMKSFSVLRECGVQDEKGNTKRIDLLLQNEDEAIIIENKVYAALYNRLDLYWNKPNVPEENKRGIVLSPWATPVKFHNFVNITHEDFAHTIENNLSAYFATANPKSLILLQDFIQNIYNVTHAMNEEEVYFYFENREKINRLAEIRKNVVSHIWKTIEEDGNTKLLKPLFKENGMKLSIKTKNNVDYCYYTFDALPDKVMLTLVYDTLWNYDKDGCRIRMFLELQSKEMIKFVKDMKDTLELEPDGHKEDTTWWHYKGTKITFTPKELANSNDIATRIVNTIKESHFYEDGQKIIALWKEHHK